MFMVNKIYRVRLVELVLFLVFLIKFSMCMYFCLLGGFYICYCEKLMGILSVFFEELDLYWGLFISF